MVTKPVAPTCPPMSDIAGIYGGRSAKDGAHNVFARTVCAVAPSAVKRHAQCHSAEFFFRFRHIISPMFRQAPSVDCSDRHSQVFRGRADASDFLGMFSQPITKGKATLRFMIVKPIRGGSCFHLSTVIQGSKRKHHVDRRLFFLVIICSNRGFFLWMEAGMEGADAVYSRPRSRRPGRQR